MRKAQILVDHKTFPNPDEAAIIAHIRENYLGQMSAYAGAIARATGAAPTRILMHFPLAGRVAEVVLDA